MHKKFKINWTKIKGGCQSGRKVVPHDSKSDLPLIRYVTEKTQHFLTIFDFSVQYACFEMTIFLKFLNIF